MRRLVILLLIGYLPSSAQPAFTITNYTVENGLPQNTVRGMAFDKTGFLWIATENGLVRFNGAKFKQFFMPGDSRLSSFHRSIEERILVTDVTNQIAEIKDGRLNILRQADPDTRTRLEYTVGTQLSGTLFQKLLSMNFLQHKREGNALRNLVPLSGSQYVIVHQKGISLYKDTTLLHQTPFPSAGTYEVCRIGGQFAVFHAVKGFFSFNADKGKWEKLFLDTALRYLEEVKITWKEHQERPYIIYRNRLYSLHKQKNQLQAKLLIDSLGNTSPVNSVEYHPGLALFAIGTVSQGLFLYRRASFLQRTDPRHNDPVYGQYPVATNAVVTNKGEIYSMTPTNGLRPFFPAFDNYIISDSSHHLYYASGDTVYRFHSGKPVPEKLFISSNSQSFVLNYHRDTLWMINANGIFFRNQERNDTSFLFPPHQNNQPHAMERISPGKFLYGNCAGLFAYQPANRKIDTLLWMPQKCVRTLWRYGNLVFIGTYGRGWKVLSGNKIINMPLDQKGYLRFAHCFFKDKKDYLWITTNHGIFKYYLPDVEKYIAGQTSALYSFHYGKSNGISNLEFNGGCHPCAVQLQNGYTSLPNLGGVVWFKPEETDHPSPEGGILIDQIKSDGEVMAIDEPTLSLPAGTRRLRIEIGFLAFVNEGLDPVQFRTIGMDTSWRFLSHTDPAISYTTLPAGDYRLEIRKLQGFGKGYVTKTFVFSVAHPWYLTTVAKIGWVLASMILVAGIIKIRIALYRRRQVELEKVVEQKVAELKSVNQKLKKNVQVLESYQQELLKRDARKSRFIKIISHDLIGPLQFIKMITEQTRKYPDAVDKKSLAEIMGEIQTTVSGLLNLCTNLVNWIRSIKENFQLSPSRFDLYNVVEEKIQFFRTQANRKDLRLINHCPQEFFICNDIHAMRVMLHNLLSNAVKFASHGRIGVSAGRDEKHYFLSVSDTGRGISKQQIGELLTNNLITSYADTENNTGHGLGFMIVRELAAATGGTVKIESTPGAGTIITLQWSERQDLLQPSGKNTVTYA